MLQRVEQAITARQPQGAGLNALGKVTAGGAGVAIGFPVIQALALGFVQADEMAKVVEQCGVFVLPSTYEPWGVVVHEHACAGLPLVLSHAVGAGERFLAPGENGVRFVAGDGADLRKALLQLMERSDADLLLMGRHSHTLGGLWTPAEWARTVMDLMKARREA